MLVVEEQRNTRDPLHGHTIAIFFFYRHWFNQRICSNDLRVLCFQSTKLICRFSFFRRRKIIRILLRFLLFFSIYSRSDSFISLLLNFSFLILLYFLFYYTYYIRYIYSPIYLLYHFSFFIFVVALFVVEILFQWLYDLTRNIKYFF